MRTLKIVATKCQRLEHNRELLQRILSVIHNFQLDDRRWVDRPSFYTDLILREGFKTFFFGRADLCSFGLLTDCELIVDSSTINMPIKMGVHTA
jgi:hypothetical protein